MFLFESSVHKTTRVHLEAIEMAQILSVLLNKASRERRVENNMHD